MEYAAEEPRPAPMGRLEEAVNVPEILRTGQLDPRAKIHRDKVTDALVSLPATTM